MDNQARQEYYTAINERKITQTVYNKLYQVLTIPDLITEASDYCVKKSNIHIFDSNIDTDKLRQYKVCLNKFHQSMRLFSLKSLD